MCPDHALHYWRCGQVNTVPARVGKELPDVRCTICGSTIFGCGHVEASEGILSRAQQEINGGEYALAVLFAAMALESQLASLFYKRRRIDARIKTGPEPSLDGIEEEYRRIGGIIEKLNATAQLLVGKSLDSLVSDQEQTLASWIDEFAARVFPEGEIAKTLRERLFWPRNHIVHFGEVDVERGSRGSVPAGRNSRNEHISTHGPDTRGAIVSRFAGETCRESGE
jgi:hypothetical protein